MKNMDVTILNSLKLKSKKNNSFRKRKEFYSFFFFRCKFYYI